MPELPEVEIVTRRLDAALAGSEVESALAPGMNVMKTFDPPLAELEGRAVAGGQNLLRLSNLPLAVNPFRPSWGEAYTAIRDRMVPAVLAARDAAHGHEAVIVSHQLPIWTARNKLAGHRLWHDPRRRECTLASLTSLTYSGDELSSITYSEPAAALLGQASRSVGA